MLFFGSFTDNSIWCTFTAANFCKLCHLRRSNGQNIALLGFVTPHFQRAHTRFVIEDIAQFKATTTATIAHQLRHGVGQTASTDIMNKQNWVVVIQLPAAINHFLTAALHFRVIALYRSKIQICIRLAGCHGRSSTTTQTDVHRWPTEHHQLGTDGNFAFLHMTRADITNPAR
ncbi:Uncharacterised protein [Yersinia enterocolitica]|nr:Uncharacterised protein [Yersinia enterocolitica]